MTFVKPSRSRSAHSHRPIFLLFVLAVLACIVFAPAPARSAGQIVSLVVGAKQVPFVVPPYEEPDGQVWAPADFVRLLGADYAPGHGDKLIITSAGGRSFEQSYRIAQDRYMIPVKPVASDLGAVVGWDSASHTMTLRARILMVREDHNVLSIVTSYPVYYHVDSLDNPARLFVDVYGAALASPGASVPAQGDNLLRIRSGQPSDNTVRLVLDLRRAIHYEVAAAMQTSDIQVALNTDQTSSAYLTSASADTSEASEEGRGDPDEVEPPSQSAGAPSDFRITDIEFKQEDGGTQVIVTTQGIPPNGPNGYRAFLLDDPVRLAFDLPGASYDLAGALASNPDAKIALASPDVADIRWGTVPAQNGKLGRVVLDLAHTVAYAVSTVSSDAGNTYIIAINPTTNPDQTVASDNGAGDTGIPGPTPAAEGSLSGKTVVVDPGHGGKDGGAPGIGGVWEKNLTLPIAKELCDVLSASGARVIMTRADDTFIPLRTRAQIGVDQHADFFISIHCDSSGARNSQEGTTVYYHANGTACHTLASIISTRLSQLDDGIHADGAKTDYIRFPGIGYSVLRHSPEPAVLVECGYVNNDHDLARLEDPEVRHQIALGIAAGLRDFIGYRMAQR